MSDNIEEFNVQILAVLISIVFVLGLMLFSFLYLVTGLYRS